MLCFECLEEIGKQRVCPYCGTEMFPTAKEAKKILKKSQKDINRQKEEKGFSDEEILTLGLYPKDEGYKMSLISRILEKR